MSTENTAPIVIYGGNGFVGAAICEAAARQGYHCISVSRRGIMPLHLQHENAPWLDRVQWLQGDATTPDVSLLRSARAVINAVGSPPLPTLTQAAFDHQLKMNGESQQAVVAAATEAGLDRIVVIGADIPGLLQTNSFAYYVGKKHAYEAAKVFATSDKGRQAAVLQPAAIYGTRHTAGGRAIALAVVMAPVSGLLQRLPKTIQHYLPAAFVDVGQVALAAVMLATVDDVEADINGEVSTACEGFRVVSNDQLLHWQL